MTVRYPILDTQETAPTAAGRALLTDADSAAQRTSLGLGDSATLSVGTGVGTVAAGNDSRITGALQSANNLSDLASASTARTSLGLGDSATLNVGTAVGTVAAGNDSRITGAAQKSSNLSDLASASTARTNLGAVPADWTTVTAADLSLRNGTRGTVSLSGGKLRFTLDAVAAAYYDGTARTAPRAYWIPPTTARQVVVVARVYTRVSGTSNASSSLAVLLRPGTDDTADPLLAAPTPAWSMNSASYPSALVGVSFRDAAVIAHGDFYPSGYDGSGTGVGGAAWPATPSTSTDWIGARWTWPQRMDLAVARAPAASPPTATNFVWPSTYAAPATTRDNGTPPMVVVTYKQWATVAAGTIDVEVTVYWR